MKPRDLAKVALGVLILGWMSVLVVACHGCGHVPPKPPPGYVSCDTACEHEATLPCDVAYDLCTRICNRVNENQPAWPNCVSVATSCAEFNACKDVKAADAGQSAGP